MNSSKIFLIGLPGSGKTTLGKKIAEIHHRPFFDLDEEIVKKAGISITDLFESKGEDFFRQLESETLQILISTESNFVLSTGGGTPCFFSNMEINEPLRIDAFSRGTSGRNSSQAR